MASNYDLTQLRDGMLATADQVRLFSNDLANAYLDCAHRVGSLIPQVSESPTNWIGGSDAVMPPPEPEPVPMVTVAVENKPRRRK
jgi:hypothetical protein